MSTTTEEDADGYIVKTDGVLGGKPRLTGHRLSVLDVVELLHAGYVTADIVKELSITPDEVHAARRYYEGHSEEMAELERRRREKHEELRRSSKAP